MNSIETREPPPPARERALRHQTCERPHPHNNPHRPFHHHHLTFAHRPPMARAPNSAPLLPPTRPCAMLPRSHHHPPTPPRKSFATYYSPCRRRPQSMRIPVSSTRPCRSSPSIGFMARQRKRVRSSKPRPPVWKTVAIPNGDTRTASSEHCSGMFN